MSKCPVASSIFSVLKMKSTFSSSLSTRKISLFYSSINCILFILGVTSVVDYICTYLTYKTDSKIAPYIPIDMEIPKLSLCFTHHTLLEPKMSYSFFVKPKYISSYERICKLTTLELFQSTPEPRDVLSSCRFRLNNTGPMGSFTGSECLEHFNLTKYLIRGYTCYRIVPKVTYKTYDLPLVSNLFDFRRILFEVSISSPLNRGNKMMAMLHFGEIPFVEKYFVFDSLSIASQNEYYALGYEIFRTQTLPSPYDTRCVNRVESTIKYVSECANEVLLKEQGKLFYETYLFHPINVSFASLSDIIHGQTGSFTSRALSNCWRKYESVPLCDEIFCMVNSESFASREKLTFGVKGTTFPVFLKKTYPKLPFGEFLLQTFTIFGIWFGASIYGLSSLWPSVKRHIFWSIRSKDLLKSDSLAQITSDLKLIWESKAHLDTKLSRLDTNLTGPRVEGVKSVTPRAKSARVAKVASLIMKTTIFISLVVQICLVLSSYMEYKTIMSFAHDVLPESQIPDINLCFSVSNLLNQSTETNSTFFDQIQNLMSKITLYDRLTLEEIYQRALDPQSVISGCRVRHNVTMPLEKLMDPVKCVTKFHVGRFYLKNQICYMFRKKTQRVKSLVFLHKHSEQTDTSGIIFSLILNPVTQKFFRIEVIVNVGGYPEQSNSYSNEVFRRKGNSLFLTSFSNQEFVYLEAPYDTNCYQFQGEGCINSCMINKTLDQLNYLPYSQLLVKSHKRKILGHTDLINKSIAFTWNQIENACFQRCKNPSCRETLTRTFISYAYESEYPLEFALHTQMYPDVWSIAQPMIYLGETIYKIVCFIAFWLGVNLLSLNPVEIWLKLENKKVTRLMRRKVKEVALVVPFIEKWTSAVAHSIGCDTLTQIEPGPSVVRSKFQIRWASIVKLFCVIGCCFTVFLATSSYFRYPTLINTRMDLMNNFSSPRMSLCFRMEDFGMKNVFNYSMEQLFQLTPEADQVMNSCGFRGIHEESYSNLSSVFRERVFITSDDFRKCYLNFEVKKFLLQNFVCYSFRYKHLINVSLIQSFFNRPNQIFMIGIKTQFIKGHILVTISDTLPFESNIWSPVVRVSGTKSKWYTVSYIKFVHRVLPKPYDHDGYLNSANMRSIRFCSRNHLVSLRQQESPTWLVFEPNKLRYSKFDENYLNIRAKCIHLSRNQGVYEPSPEESFDNFVTTVSVGQRSKLRTAASFSLRSTNYPYIVTTFHAMKSTFNLFLDVGSIISIWFGLSIIACDPFELIVKKQTGHQEVSIEETVNLFAGRIHRLKVTLQDINQLLNEARNANTENEEVA